MELVYFGYVTNFIKNINKSRKLKKRGFLIFFNFSFLITTLNNFILFMEISVIGEIF